MATSGKILNFIHASELSKLTAADYNTSSGTHFNDIIFVAKEKKIITHGIEYTCDGKFFDTITANGVTATVNDNNHTITFVNGNGITATINQSTGEVSFNHDSSIAAVTSFQGSATAAAPSSAGNDVSVISGIKYDKNGHITAVQVQKLTLKDTDTHYTATNVVSSTSTGTTAASTSTGNSSTWLNLVENNTKRSSIQITGTGGTTVDAKSNKIEIHSENTTYDIATATTAGLVKSSTTGTTANRDYNVEVKTDGTMKVNVPWENTTYSAATASALGLIKIGYTQSGKNYPVQLSSEKAYVNVPWTDTHENVCKTFTLSGPVTGTTTITTSATSATIATSVKSSSVIISDYAESSTNSVIDNTDSIDAAFGKAQKQITDIKAAIAGGTHFIGVKTALPTDASSKQNGNICFVKDSSNNTTKEYIYDGDSSTWIELGDEGLLSSLATKVTTLEGKPGLDKVGTVTNASSAANNHLTLSTTGTTASTIKYTVGVASGYQIPSTSDISTWNGKVSFPGWDDMPAATTTALGGIQTNYTTNDKNYAVTTDASGNAYVNVPWSDTTYKTAVATSATGTTNGTTTNTTTFLNFIKGTSVQNSHKISGNGINVTAASGAITLTSNLSVQNNASTYAKLSGGGSTSSNLTLDVTVVDTSANLLNGSTGLATAKAVKECLTWIEYT